MCFSLPSVFENSGNLVVREVATQPLTQDLLLSSVRHLKPLKHFLFVESVVLLNRSLIPGQDCYILDHKGSSVMVWKGKKASKAERQAAFNRALVGHL